MPANKIWSGLGKPKQSHELDWLAHIDITFAFLLNQYPNFPISEQHHVTSYDNILSIYYGSCIVLWKEFKFGQKKLMISKLLCGEEQLPFEERLVVIVYMCNWPKCNYGYVDSS